MGRASAAHTSHSMNASALNQVLQGPSVVPSSINGMGVPSRN